ncbi:MAG TPA: hypothetical protein V6C58_22140 [Allocoleopsis sp.]
MKLTILLLKEDKLRWKSRLDQFLVMLEKVLMNESSDLQLSLVPFKRTKTHDQLKGVHKLCELLAVRLQEANGVPYDLETAKLWVKVNFGFTRKATKQECIAEALNQRLVKKMTRKEFDDLIKSFEDNLLKPKSFSEASKEDIYQLITQIEELAKKMDWQEVQLLDEEKRNCK